MRVCGALSLAASRMPLPFLLPRHCPLAPTARLQRASTRMEHHHRPGCSRPLSTADFTNPSLRSVPQSPGASPPWFAVWCTEQALFIQQMLSNLVYPCISLAWTVFSAMMFMRLEEHAFIPQRAREHLPQGRHRVWHPGSLTANQTLSWWWRSWWSRGGDPLWSGYDGECEERKVRLINSAESKKDALAVRMSYLGFEG